MSKLTEGLSVAVLVATVAVSFYMYSFYGCIGVDIFNYLDASEILTSQFKLLLVFSIVGVSGFFLTAHFTASIAHLFAPKEVEAEMVAKIELTDDEKAEAATQAAKHNILGWLDGPPGLTIKNFSIFVALCCSIAVAELIFSPVKYPAVIATALIGLAGIGVIRFNKFVFEGLSKLYRGKYFSHRELADEAGRLVKFLVIIEGVATLLAITYVSAQDSMQDVMLVASRNNAVIELDNKTISTNDTLIYVGRTRNFVFLFQKVKGEAEIISSDKIVRLTLSPGSKSRVIPASYVNPMYRANPAPITPSPVSAHRNPAAHR